MNYGKYQFGIFMLFLMLEECLLFSLYLSLFKAEYTEPESGSSLINVLSYNNSGYSKTRPLKQKDISMDSNAI